MKNIFILCIISMFLNLNIAYANNGLETNVERLSENPISQAKGKKNGLAKKIIKLRDQVNDAVVNITTKAKTDPKMKKKLKLGKKILLNAKKAVGVKKSLQGKAIKSIASGLKKLKK